MQYTFYFLSKTIWLDAVHLQMGFAGVAVGCALVS